MAQADIDRMEDRVGRPPESIVRRPTAVISQVAWLAAQEGMVVYDDEDEHEQDAASMVRKSRGSMRVSRHVSRFSVNPDGTPRDNGKGGRVFVTGRVAIIAVLVTAFLTSRFTSHGRQKERAAAAAAAAAASESSSNKLFAIGTAVLALVLVIAIVLAVVAGFLFGQRKGADDADGGDRQWARRTVGGSAGTRLRRQGTMYPGE